MNSPYSTKLGYKIFAALTIVLLALATLPVQPAHALACTFTSNNTGNWNAAIWNAVGTGCSAYPGQTFAGDTVIISAGNAVTVNVALVASLGAVTVNGTLDNTNAVNLPALASLTINNGGAATFNRNLTVNGATNIAGTINFGSTDATARLMTFNGPVTLNAGASWNETAAGNGVLDQFGFGDNFTNNASTFNGVSTGVHTFSGVNRAISGTTTTSILGGFTFSGSYTNSNILISPPSSIFTIATGVTLTNNGTITADRFTVNGTLINNGTVTTGSLGVSLAGTGGVTNNATGVLNINGGSTITTLDASAVGNKVYYSGAANQSLHVNAYSYLYLSGGGVKSIFTGTSVVANLDISGPPPTMSITTGVTIPVTTLSFSSVNQATGTWGPTGSGATHIDNTHFSNTLGVLNVSATVPTVTTNPATAITTTTATLNGLVNANNASTTVTFEYGLTTGYGSTATAAESPVTGTTNTAVTAGIIGLAPNTLYHFRVVGANVGGTVNGLDVTFTTIGSAPAVTTQAVTGIGITTATGNGNITDLGVPNPTAHGVVWNTTGTPTTADSVSDLGAASATGAFTAPMTGLAPNTLYYVRAFATNIVGTSYGAEVTFTTNPLVPVVTTQAVTGIGTTTATGNGDITSLGSPNPTAHGVVWNTTGTPTTADSVSDLGAASATGAFTAPMTGLAPNTLYYVRAFATNTAGTSYGAEVTFSTNGVAPTVTTQAVTGIGMTSATGNGNITNLGVPNPTAYGVVWNTTGTPTTADSVNDLGAASATGAFTAPIGGLSMNTVYYVRAFATNTAGTSYGAEVSFQTTGTAPTLSPVHIQSNNVNPAFAKTGDTITLTFTASTSITTPTVTIAGHAATVSGGPVNWTATYTVVASDPDGLVAFSISNFSDLFGNAGSPVTFTTDASIVTIFNTIPTVSASTPADNAILTTGPTQIFVQFNKDVLHDGSSRAADNLANYLLVGIGANGVFDTPSCADGAFVDDVNIPINSLNYTNNGGTGPFQATLNINGGVALPVGTYRLFVCGTTSIYDVAGNVLNNRADSRVTFSVQLAQQPAALPATGFAPDRVTVLPIQSADKAYAGLGSLWLEIPTLGVKMSIVGVPQTSGNWDVSWLGSQAGWLQGSAFPTWVGNSVLTAHVTDANGKSGPFAGLKNLVYGDRIIIHMQGQQYIYEVRDARTLTANNSSYVFKSLDKYSYLTLLTCQGYNPQTEKYTYRRVVRAVLVSVQADK